MSDASRLPQYSSRAALAAAARARTLRYAIRAPKLVTGALITALFCIVAVTAKFWTPVTPTQIRIPLKLRPPLAEGLIGTDHLGRDVLSMLMAGTWNSLSIALAAVLLGAVIGTALGSIAAARRDLFDTLIMRICDVTFAFPPIVSALMLGALLGGGRPTAIIAIGVFMIPVFARIARAASLQAWSRDYVTAAMAIGKSTPRIAIEHVLPNIFSQIVVQVTIQLGLAILTEAGLSFLGLGTPPPNPSWGRMLADAQTYLAAAPHLAIAPGATIALAVFGFNQLGDGLRDLLDPRRRTK
jgi:peptide/nickel transport system permease protein